MRTLPIVVVIFTALFEAHHNVQAQEKSCRTAVQELTKIQMGLMATCTKSMKFKNGKDKSKKLNCILRCAMIEAKLTDKDGQVTLDSVDFLLNKYIPPSLIEKANSTFFPCMEMGIKNKFKTLEEDEFCLTYDPFIKCFLQKATGFCN